MLLSRIIRNCSPSLRSLGTFSKDSKKFYKEVDVITTDAGYQVTLNKSNVKTPLKNQLVLPTETLANAVAVEWDLQRENIIFALMPLTTLCFKATDKPHEGPALVEHMTEFLRTDTVCYRAGPREDPQLHSLETSRWNPVTDWFSEHYHVHLALTTDIMLTPQPEQTISTIRSHLLKQHPWTLPAYHHSTTSLKSLVIAMAMLDGGLSAEEAIACSYLESDYQMDRWGEVEWGHTIDKARQSADVAAAVLLVNEIRSLDGGRLQAWS